MHEHMRQLHHAAPHHCIECDTAHCDATTSCEYICLEDHAESEPTRCAWDANFEYRCDADGVWS